MWVVTPLGTFSIRCTPADTAKGTLTIESRTRSDLEALVAAVLPSACPIIEVIARQRGYMTRSSRGEVALALSTLALDLNYDDFVETFVDQQNSARIAVAEPLMQVLNSH